MALVERTVEDQLNTTDFIQDYPVLTNALLSQAIPFALISAHSTAQELYYALKLSKATHIFVHSNLLPVVSTSIIPLNIGKDDVHILEGPAPHGHRTLDELVAIAKANRITSIPIRQVNKTTLAYLLFSSGTSGLPKGMLYLDVSQASLTDHSCRHISPQCHFCLATVWNLDSNCYALSIGEILFLSVVGMYTDSFRHLHQAPKPLPSGQIPKLLAFLPMYHTFGFQIFTLRSVDTRAPMYDD